MLKILRMLGYLQTVNVIYSYQNINDKEDTVFIDGSMVFTETCLRSDLPKTGEAIIYKGNHFRIATIWHDKDENIVEIDLNDL